jgi:hypothetical protein
MKSSIGLSSLSDLERRMQWLGAGSFGNRAGDILLLARACGKLPIQDRYYFAGISHHTWHGSACEQDSHIPFILAKPAGRAAGCGLSYVKLPAIRSRSWKSHRWFVSCSRSDVSGKR